MSRFTVRAFAPGLLSALGHWPTTAARQYEGEARLVRGPSTRSSFASHPVPDSLEAVDDVSEKTEHDIESKMKQEVLETSRFPEIVVESSNTEAAAMGYTLHAATTPGTLSLHEKKRTETIRCQVSLNGETLHARGQFPVRQTHYGIRPAKVAAATLKVRDEVKCSFDIVARKRDWSGELR
jgi:YceI-like domain